MSGGTIAGIVIGSIVGTLFILWLIYVLRGTGNKSGYTHGTAGQGRRGSAAYYDDGTGDYVRTRRAGSRRSRDSAVYREGGRGGSRGRGTSNAREGDAYVAYEKVAAPRRVVYRD
jgi:hypothetical protein